MVNRLFLACVAAVFLCSVSAVCAQSYTAAVGEIPGTESLEMMIKALGEDAGVDIKIIKVPMQRMVAMLDAKNADMGVPMLAVKDKEKLKFLPFDYSTEPLQQMYFVLYTNSAKPVTAAGLKKGNTQGYKIESDVSNMTMFSFPVLPSTNPEGSLKKLSEGLIDGYIMAGASIDPLLRALKFKNIRRQHFDTFDIVFALRKNDRGGPVDKFLSSGLKKLKASGRYDKIMGDSSKTGIYEEWQP